MPTITVNFVTYESVEIEISSEELRELKEEEALSDEIIERADKEIYDQHPSISCWEIDDDNPYDPID